MKRAQELISGVAPGRSVRALLAARLDLACTRPDAATARLVATGFANLPDRLACHLLLARAADDLGLPHAERHMARAVQLAIPEGFIKVFLEEGSNITHQARAAAEALNTPAGTRFAVALGSPLPTHRFREPSVILSEREYAVLRYLPSRLTNQDISRECFISVNTVKFHLKSIYTKLGVSTRSDAIDRARLLGLL